MKSYKKFAKIILVLLFFIAIIFAVSYFFKVIFKVEGEARLVEMNLPAETQNIKSAIDEVKIEKLKWKDALLIKGWVFKENVSSAKRELFLVLKSKYRSLVFKSEKDSIMRPDVSAGFHLVGGVNNHGFELSVPLYLLKENAYQVGFVLWDETGKYYMMTSISLGISDAGVTLIDSGSALDSKSKSNKVSISLKAPTGKIKYYFDKISNSDNNLTIIGWGYLPGMNSDSLKSYILLKKNETVTVFSVVVQTRKDVTNAFKELRLNLDSSGFLAQITAENLEKGHYQIGLYIVRGDQTGMIYSDKYMDIGK